MLFCTFLSFSVCSAIPSSQSKFCTSYKNNHPCLRYSVHGAGQIFLSKSCREGLSVLATRARQRCPAGSGSFSGPNKVVLNCTEDWCSRGGIYLMWSDAPLHCNLHEAAVQKCHGSGDPSSRGLSGVWQYVLANQGDTSASLFLPGNPLVVWW